MLPNEINKFQIFVCDVPSSLDIVEHVTFAASWSYEKLTAKIQSGNTNNVADN